MKNTNISLIQLYGNLQPPDAEPLSIEILSAAALQSFPSLNINMQTLSIKDSSEYKENIIEIMLTQNPILIGLSIPQSTFDLAIDLLRNIYQNLPDANIILGHALPTHSPEMFLQMFPRLIIVRGWGEDSFVQLIDYFLNKSLSLEQIPSLCFLKDHELHFTPIIWPDKIINPLRWNSHLYFPRVEASRGCQHDICTFCTRQPRDKKRDHAWSRRPIEQIIEDILILKSKGKTSFTFTDEDFIGNDLGSAQDLAESLSNIRDIQFSLSVRADNILNPQGTFAENEQRRQLFELLRKSGLYLVFIGIESLSNSQLKRYAKGVNADDCIKSVQVIQNLGIGFEMGYILFDPLMNPSELIENLDRLDESGLWANVGSLFHQLRPQKGSNYLRLLIRSEMVKNYNPNSMLYNYEYSDHLISEIAQLCSEWYKDIENIYRLARNMERVGSFNGVYVYFIFGIRALGFRLLRTLARNRITYCQSIGIQSLASFSEQRLGLVKGLYHSLLSKSSLTETESALKKLCSNFILRELGSI
ncbi:B12-binding domain-containing radical SAM protein [Herpetosiphon giganteus]|uniref:B12-binding domain-containing radical SAM protein n=1 Tax=Herpetosiphon giganteus TaxID=2029754 RepID=UPI0019587A1C|nr:radical SAM protein [Herpetosiphon giganteus]MBM7846494.1 hypothetical protein [Herpetosiphon giganteus]